MNFSVNNKVTLGLSEKKDGSMKRFLKNRYAFYKKKGLDRRIIISAGLSHGNKVVVVTDFGSETVISDCDALISNNSKYLLTLTVADCLPIYFYDKNKQVVAIAHAGWRGVVSEIAVKVIKSFVDNYSSNPEDIQVFIGPHIKDCHFEIKDDIADNFKEEDSVIRGGSRYVNLSQIVKKQLLLQGLKKSNINISDDCSFCLSEKYFSFRRDKPKILETMQAYIGLD